MKVWADEQLSTNKGHSLPRAILRALSGIKHPFVIWDQGSGHITANHFGTSDIIIPPQGELK